MAFLFWRVGPEEFYLKLEAEKPFARLRCEADTRAERNRWVSLLGRGVGGSRDIPDSKSSSGWDSKQLIPEHKRTMFTAARGVLEIDGGSLRHAEIPLVKAIGLGALTVRLGPAARVSTCYWPSGELSRNVTWGWFRPMYTNNSSSNNRNNTLK
jgi:hypothetical protein